MGVHSDTISVVPTALSFYPSHYPDVYAKIVAETRKTFPTRSSIREGSSPESCEYRYAFLNEVSPPISGSPLREVEQGRAIVAGEYFPSGSDVGCCLYAVHHKKPYFPDSFRFMPEQWIESKLTVTPEQRQLAAGALKPFSIGPKACAGRSLAMLELSLTTAKILWTLDFRRAKGQSGNWVKEDLEFRWADIGLTSTNSSVTVHPQERVQGFQFRHRKLETVSTVKSWSIHLGHLLFGHFLQAIDSDLDPSWD